MILRRSPRLIVALAGTLAVVALALFALGAFASSGPSCADWRAHALTEEQAAYRSAVAWAHAYVADLPNTPSLADQRDLAATKYRVELIPLARADSKSSRWRHLAATCSTPPFTPTS